jgi:hypothetical protein
MTALAAQLFTFSFLMTVVPEAAVEVVEPTREEFGMAEPMWHEAGMTAEAAKRSLLTRPWIQQYRQLAAA